MIEIENVTKVYGMGDVEVRALRGVNLKIEQGEMVALMGPSGSGKSTLMNILGCLDQPSTGTYVLDGLEVSKLTDNRLAEIRSRKIGFVFQTFNLLPRASAIANVELPLIYSGGRGKGRAREALERVGLLRRADHRPSQLSGGEQQRVAIARALVNRPSIILADEPTGNLDSKAGAEIMAIFEELNRQERITILLVTHDQDVGNMSQRIIRLKDGIITGEEIVREAVR
ncbi:MAG: ABC transporter ATP-binding protein [Dehalococcoidia bacterium]|jgi:putative ABC transport system ATP-binding protein|nr:ABC transporter ATP-binding protein [Dehalococcoidia bacterium]MDP7239881.1 ABC transporter ATP-binding protein [Dehalococcoidia bacterium]